MVFENTPLNVKLFYLINHSRNPFLDMFFSKFYLLGKGWVLIPTFFLVATFLREKLKVFLYALLINTSLVHLIKHITDQPRPASILEDVFLLEPLYQRSFPSGDTAMAFFLASFFLSINRLLGAVFLVYAFLIAYERIYVGAHFPLDVLAGALIGVLSYLLVSRLKEKKCSC
ncbi:phosphatase PAP2 family protein [Thermocrinis sp.]